jgi:PilZ domain
MRYDKRQIVRKRTDQLLYLELGDANGGIILNLSEEGCNFQAIGPVLEKDLPFEFALGGGQQIHGKGQITWLDGTRKLGGLRFNGLSAEQRQQIRTWLQEAKAVDDTGEGFALAAAAAPVDSLAKLRRKQLREEARLQWESAQRGAANGSPAEQPQAQPGAARNHDENLRAPATTLQGVVEEVFAHEEKKRAVVQASQPTRMTPEKVQSLRSEILGLREQIPAGMQAEQLLPTAQEEAPVPKTTGVSRAVAAIIAAAMLAAGGIIYHREIGQSLIWVGAAITGDKPAPKNVTPHSAEATPGALKNPMQEIATPSDQTGTGSSPTLTNLRPIQQSAGVTPPSAGGPAARMDPPSRARDVKNSVSSASDDVQALWALVESGDTRAEVKLADHYARGDGVIKSCGQAKVLLNAAAKRGDLEAKRKLYELEQTGCP